LIIGITYNNKERNLKNGPWNLLLNYADIETVQPDLKSMKVSNDTNKWQRISYYLKQRSPVERKHWN
jgi:hypothetical protein